MKTKKERKTPGRKPTNQPKKKRYNICLSEVARGKLETLAQERIDRSASAWIEAQIMAA